MNPLELLAQAQQQAPAPGGAPVTPPTMPNPLEVIKALQSLGDAGASLASLHEKLDGVLAQQARIVECIDDIESVMPQLRRLADGGPLALLKR